MLINKNSTLEGLINLPKFKDKILYINLYNFYCKHSVNEFPYIRKLQKTIQEASKDKKEVVLSILVRTLDENKTGIVQNINILL